MTISIFATICFYSGIPGCTSVFICNNITTFSYISLPVVHVNVGSIDELVHVCTSKIYMVLPIVHVEFLE